jgi:DNA-directed RNA polymerase sigma subunit (sigma70/sigma32)
VSGHRPSFDEREALFRSRLRALAGAPLMTSAQELAAAASVADGRAAENELAALRHDDVTDIDRVQELRRRVSRGDVARSDLIASCRRLVVSLARRHPAPAHATEVLLEVGDDALSRAVDRYDPTGGLPFSSFARWWIERAMREVELDPIDLHDDLHPEPADPALLTALGHLHQDDCRVIELRLGLTGGPALDPQGVASVLGIDEDAAEDREERALAKLRHPCTPGDLTSLKRL